MTRYTAALTHLAVSATVVGIALSAIFLVWYRGPIFVIAGAVTPVLVMVCVDLVLGPFLTLVVYKPGKPGLRFDLGFIFLVQAVALGYGTWTLYSERPNFLVYAVDRFSAVAEKHVDRTKIPFDELTDERIFGLTPVFARMPADPERKAAFFDSVLVDGQPDLEYRAEFWEPLSAGAAEIRNTALRFGNLRPADDREVFEFERARGRLLESASNAILVPVFLQDDDLALILDPDSLQPLATIPVYAYRDRDERKGRPAQNE